MLKIKVYNDRNIIDTAIRKMKYYKNALRENMKKHNYCSLALEDDKYFYHLEIKKLNKKDID